MLSTEPPTITSWAPIQSGVLHVRASSPPVDIPMPRCSPTPSSDLRASDSSYATYADMMDREDRLIQLMMRVHKLEARVDRHDRELRSAEAARRRRHSH